MRRLERMLLRFVFALFALAEESNICRCEECAMDREKLRRRRRVDKHP